jgi:hypothetical protein
VIGAEREEPDVKAVVVYESMFGCTHRIADRIGEGIRGGGDEAAGVEVEVVPVDAASVDVLAGVDLLVVGGPTHMHGMSVRRSRAMAVDMAAEPDRDLELDPDAEGEDLRAWFHGLSLLGGVVAAAFDTRLGSVAPAMSGRASKGIARRLRHHGLTLAAPPESFLIDDDNHLVDGEEDRARRWGAALASTVAGVTR